MCGRYAFDDFEEIYEARKILEDISEKLGEDAASGVKTGEIFPSENAAVVAQTKTGRRAYPMPWGYPFGKRLIINARSETMLEKPMFQKSVLHQKCLVPCTGFYEWSVRGGKKQKFLIRPEGERFFYLAGLYRPFYENKKQKYPFVVITAPASDYMKDIHQRMPLMVPVGCKDAWLSGDADHKKIDAISSLTSRLDITVA